MGKAPNPFSLFDFLGYFFPGAIAVYSVVLGYGHVSQRYRAADALKEIFSLTDPQNVLPFILAAYVLGHFLSFVSSLTVEKYLYWQYGFPSKFLLGLPYTPYFPKRVRASALDLFKLLVILVLFPVFVFDQAFGRIFNMSGFYAKGLDPLTAEIVRKKTGLILRNVAGIEPSTEKHGKPSEVDFFTYLYHYALEHAPHHGPKMQNYVALYGFLRTLSLLAVVYFWIAVWHVWFSGLAWTLWFFTLVPIAAATFVFFLAYFKFLRRYSLEVFMAASVSYNAVSGASENGD